MTGAAKEHAMKQQDVKPSAEALKQWNAPRLKTLAGEAADGGYIFPPGGEGPDSYYTTSAGTAD